MQSCWYDIVCYIPLPMIHIHCMVTSYDIVLLEHIVKIIKIKVFNINDIVRR